MRRIRLFLFLLSLMAPSLFGDPVEDLIAQVDTAQAESWHTQAISLLEEGKRSWPTDSRIPFRAGELYMDQELYRLALAEFRIAEDLKPGDSEILYEIAAAHAYLGENHRASEVLEGILEGRTDGNLRNRVIDDLSWMYFKTHRMDEGIALVEDALDSRFDRSWAHTLGTLYAGIYDFETSRLWYQRSIDDALDNNQEYFASVAHYNLSLLELAFYHYDEARRHAERSLELRERAGGHMLTGELDFLAWNLTDALSAYRRAEELDTTPLAKVDIAEFYRRIGRLDEAIRFVEEVAENTDEAWMYSFGVDRLRFDMELNLILAEAWRGKAKTEAMTPRWGGGRRIVRGLRRVTWWARSLYHDRTHRALARSHARNLRENGNQLDAAWNAYQATQGYRSIALAHLQEARTLETALTERAVPWYQLEEGIASRNPTLLRQAIQGLSREEMEPYERALRGLASKDARSLIDLYTVNPGGLRQYGLALPVHLEMVNAPPRLGRKIRSILQSASYRVVNDHRPTAATLTVASSPDGIRWYIAEPQGRTVAQVTTSELSRRSDFAPVLAGLFDRLYTTVTN